MIYTFAFANSTVGNLGVMGSIDTTTIISLFAVALSFIALYFTHLRGVSISLFHEYELPELQADDFKDDVPTSLPVKVSLSVLNSGNRAGIVKDLNLKFKPQPDFEEFYRNNEIKWFSIKSAKTNQPASTILVKDRDTDLVIFSGFINLDWEISMRHYLRTLDIESENLKTLLEEMLEYKKERLKKFINFLKTNEKLGDLIISYKYTTGRIRIRLKPDEKHLEVKHSYKEAIKYYKKSLENYQLLPNSIEIIDKVLQTINLLKEDLENCYTEIERPSKGDLFHFDNLHLFHFLHPKNLWINQILNKEDEEIELLFKCRNYRKIIEEDVKPLLHDLLIFNQKAHEATKALSETLKQSLVENLEKDKEPLRKRLIEMFSKLKDLKKQVEYEFKEIDL